MATYDEAGSLIDDTPGLGLASAPSTEMMPGLSDADTMGGSSFGMPNLGFAAPEPRTLSDREYLQSLPTMEKIGLMLQSFSAGVAGRESPIDKVLKERRAQERERRADLTNTITVISKGTEVLRKMPPGIARDAVAAELGKAVGGGQLGEVFKAAGDQHQEIKAVLDTFSDPDVQNQLLKACGGTTDFRTCVMTQARDKDFMDRAHAQADSKRIPGIVAKLGPMVDQTGQPVTEEAWEFGGVVEDVIAAPDYWTDGAYNYKDAQCVHETKG